MKRLLATILFVLGINFAYAAPEPTQTPVLSKAVLVVVFWSRDSSTYKEEVFVRYTSEHHGWRSAMVTCLMDIKVRSTYKDISSAADLFCVDGTYYPD